ncbi:hypothetical protein Fmac_024895 [Flemingia macrophylla]|uniref:Uncharacterized protein n=1 Tax=Flemingia macrophylla TaxID=520843 RepID=A0ABD1LQP2_9FABA
MSILRLLLQRSIAGQHSNRGQTLDREDGFQILAVSVQEMMPLSLEGVHDVATDTSSKTRKEEGNLDALVNLVTLSAVSQKPASVARVCGIRFSNDHHTKRRWLPTPTSFSARNDDIVIRGVHDVATDTSAETRKVKGKLDALVNLVTQLAVEGKQDALGNLVTQLAVNQKPASVARACGIRVHDVARDTSAETRKLVGKLDALVNFVTQLAVNQKPASVARVCGIRSSNDHHKNHPGVNEHPEAYALQISIAGHHSTRGQTLDKEDGGVHDVATNTFTEARKVEGKLDAFVNLVAQLAVNQKPASVARVYGIVLPMTTIQIPRRWLPTPSSFGARNDAIVARGVHDVATDTFAETRKVEGKLDALVNLVTQLAVNQNPASVARVCGIRSSNDHHTNATTAVEARHLIERWLPTPSSFSARNDTIVVRGVHDVATDASTETRKVEGKLDALVNLVTQLAVNQKSASIARVCGIRSSNDHHTNVCPSS